MYTFKPYKNEAKLNLSNPEQLEKNEIIENCYPLDNNKFYIFKNDDKYKIYIKDNKSIEFLGLYDYDATSQTLMIYKEEENLKKIALYKKKKNYQSFESFKDLDINRFEKTGSKSLIHKIKLIPCSPGYKNQSALIFKDNEIICIKIKNNYLLGKINLSEIFRLNNFNFNEFQFIVYFDFLLILRYDNNKCEWEGKIFSLYIVNDSTLHGINCDKIKLKDIDKNARFSFKEMKQKKYLISVNITNGAPKIAYWLVKSEISGLNFITTGANENIRNIPLSNCIVNYFYHCFLKYPIIGAIQFNYEKYEEKKVKNLKILLEEKDIDKINDLKAYINKLKIICQNKKKIESFSELMNMEIEEYNRICKEKDTSLGELLIKFLELIPIQIAKILNKKFNIMSNGENFETAKLKEINRRENLVQEEGIEKNEYENMIKFCMKESIFEFYKLPTIVICCFGTQSAGKSTFLNELTSSLFDVSGMRCTEGIWMSVKLFKHSKNGKEKKCTHICQVCEENGCYLFRHNEKIKCI